MESVLESWKLLTYFVDPNDPTHFQVDVGSLGLDLLRFWTGRHRESHRTKTPKVMRSAKESCKCGTHCGASFMQIRTRRIALTWTHEKKCMIFLM